MVRKTKNKKSPYGPPEWKEIRLSLEMPVLSNVGATAEDMGIQDDDDDWI